MRYAIKLMAIDSKTFSKIRRLFTYRWQFQQESLDLETLLTHEKYLNKRSKKCQVHTRLSYSTCVYRCVCGKTLKILCDISYVVQMSSDQVPSIETQAIAEKCNRETNGRENEAREKQGKESRRQALSPDRIIV